MQKIQRYLGLTAGTALVAGLALAQGPAANTSFFVTSVNPGNGGDLGGLAGADAHCQSLAEAAGIRGKTWHAYLSTSTVDARDRIGSGPWYNVKGEMIAANVAELHSDNHINNETAVDEHGNLPDYLELVGGEVVRRNENSLAHDMLTGTNDDGTKNEATCNNWTNGTADAQGMLGHADRLGRAAGVNSWTTAHASAGCDTESLISTGGAGLYYCFAID
jgi:hypothetical protein